MASVIFHGYRQLKQDRIISLFEGNDGYAAGEQLRDFVYVKDIVNLNLFFSEQTAKQGIYNVGTGQARTFNDLAAALIRNIGYGAINYIPFPEVLKGKYQSYTQADITALRAAGYTTPFTSLEDGVHDYYQWLEHNYDQSV